MLQLHSPRAEVLFGHHCCTAPKFLQRRAGERGEKGGMYICADNGRCGKEREEGKQQAAQLCTGLSSCHLHIPVMPTRCSVCKCSLSLQAQGVVYQQTNDAPWDGGCYLHWCMWSGGNGLIGSVRVWGVPSRCHGEEITHG